MNVKYIFKDSFDSIENNIKDESNKINPIEEKYEHEVNSYNINENNKDINNNDNYQDNNNNENIINQDDYIEDINYQNKNENNSDIKEDNNKINLNKEKK